MSRTPYELLEYKHQSEMDELNEMFIRIKVALYMDDEKLRSYHPKPTAEELDDIMLRIISILKTDNKPMRRY